MICLPMASNIVLWLCPHGILHTLVKQIIMSLYNQGNKCTCTFLYLWEKKHNSSENIISCRIWKPWMFENNQWKTDTNTWYSWYCWTPCYETILYTYPLHTCKRELSIMGWGQEVTKAVKERKYIHYIYLTSNSVPDQFITLCQVGFVKNIVNF